MPVWVFSWCSHIQPQSTVGDIFGRLIRDSELAEKVNVRMDIFCLFLMALQQSVNLSEVSAGVAIIVSRDPLTDGQLMNGWKTLYSSILRGYFPDKGKINSTVPLMFTSL